MPNEGCSEEEGEYGKATEPNRLIDVRALVEKAGRKTSKQEGEKSKLRAIYSLQCLVYTEVCQRPSPTDHPPRTECCEERCCYEEEGDKG